METPTLTKQQQKKSLSAKKVKKETIKQVLTSPFTPYWPVLTEEDQKVLYAALDKCLPIREEAAIEKPHWSVLKELSKEERKKFRPPKSDVKKFYTFGVNEVTKLLEKSAVHAVLITNEVKPRLLVMHIVDMCVIKNVPILVVPELTKSLSNRTGFSSVVFAVKNENHPLTHTVRDICINYPVSEDHIHYCRKLKCEENFTEEVKDITMQETVTSEEKAKKDFYLYRTSKHERVFKPEPSKPASDLPVFVTQSAGFLSLEDDTQKHEPKRKLSYKALVVKRLKGNKDREKRKREVINKI